jgi:flagellar biosynthesis protein FlhA
LSEIFREKASEIIGRQELQDLVDVVARRHPKIVDELIPNVLSYSEVLAVVRGLLIEKVSIRDMRTILESMADAARVSKNPIYLTEQVRRRLGPAIAQGLTESDGVLYAALLDPGCEEELRGCLLKTENDVSLAPDLATAQALLAGLQNAVEQLGLAGRRPIIVAPSDLRFALWKFAHRFMAQVIVVSQQELPPRQEVSSVASVSLLRDQLDSGSPTPVGGAPIGQESHV